MRHEKALALPVRFDSRIDVRQVCLTMPPTASIRDLRNHFPKVRKLLEREGEVVLTESGEARYRLIPYTPPRKRAAPRVDYWARLTEHQPAPLTAVQARQLHEDNRGDR